MSLYFDIVALYNVNCGLVDDIALSGRDELAGDDGFKGLQQGRQGLARFQRGAIYGMDLLDVAVAFDEEDMISSTWMPPLTRRKMTFLRIGYLLSVCSRRTTFPFKRIIT